MDKLLELEDLTWVDDILMKCNWNASRDFSTIRTALINRYPSTGPISSPLERQVFLTYCYMYKAKFTYVKDSTSAIAWIQGKIDEYER